MTHRAIVRSLCQYSAITVMTWVMKASCLSRGRRGVRDEHELIPFVIQAWPDTARTWAQEVLWSPNGAICIITFCTHRNNPDTADTQTHQQPLTKPQLSVSHNKAFYFHAFLCTVESLSVGRERERERGDQGLQPYSSGAGTEDNLRLSCHK